MKIEFPKPPTSFLSEEEISFFESITIPACNQRPEEDEIIHFFYDMKLITSENMSEKTTEELVREVFRTHSKPLLFLFLKMVRAVLNHYFDGRDEIRADEIINRLAPAKPAVSFRRKSKTQVHKEIVQDLAKYLWLYSPKMTIKKLAEKLFNHPINEALPDVLSSARKSQKTIKEWIAPFSPMPKHQKGGRPSKGYQDSEK